MNAPTLLRPTRSTSAETEAAEVVTVWPMRAAFGPHVALVSVDGQGRLWVRMSTAITMMISGLLLVLVPVAALWLAGVGLVDSGRVILEDAPAPTGQSAHADAGTVRPAAPTELPLAHDR